MPKETYSYAKRDLLICQKRPIHMANIMAYLRYAERQCQKSPMYAAKETYDMAKETYFMAKETF
jgi:hypothetical protein